MVKVTIRAEMDISEKQLLEFFKNNNNNNVSPVGTKAKELRLEKVFKEVKITEQSAERIYRRCKRSFYNCGRSTFMRDLILLEDEGKIKRKVVKGGVVGTTTLVKR